MPETQHTAVETLLVLLLIVFAVAIAVQRIRLPYMIALVLTGLLGFQSSFRHIQLTPDLILTIFLPVLLFEGAYNVPIRSLKANIIPIALLAVPGVLLGSVVTAMVVRYVLDFPWTIALLFGTLIASTDPIAVISIFRRLGVPERLALLVEGESLFNDGSAITLFQIVLAVTLTGKFFFWDGMLTFFLTVTGACAVGMLIGYTGSRLLRATDDVQIQITGTVVAAYGSFLLADYWGFSGAIAVVITSLIFGNYGSTRGITPGSVHALDTSWGFMSFVANSLIFLLIGLKLVPETLVSSWYIIAIAFVASLVGRAVAIFLLMPLLHGRHRIPKPFRSVLLWGGLRGAVSLALVLSLPSLMPDGQPFPQRVQLQAMAFGVVGVSLLLQGLTLGPLIRKIGLSSLRTASVEQDIVHARLLAVEGALLALDDANARGVLGGLSYRRLSSAYHLEQEQLQQKVHYPLEGEPEQA